MNKLKLLKEGLNVIQKFIDDQDELDKGLRVLSPTGTNVIEFGSNLMNFYIRLLSITIGDKEDWISWYVFENEFGVKRLKAGVEGKRLKIIDTPKKLLWLIELKA